MKTKLSTAILAIAAIIILAISSGCIYTQATQTNNIKIPDGGELPDGFQISFGDSANVTDSLLTRKLNGEINPSVKADLDADGNTITPNPG